MATYLDNLLAWNVYNERTPEAAYVQVVMAVLLARNNRLRNVGEFRLTDRELAYQTRLSIRRVTAAKKRLQELGFIEYETDPDAPRLVTLYRIKVGAKRDTKRDTKRDANEKIPIYARARKTKDLKTKEKEIHKEKEKVFESEEPAQVEDLVKEAEVEQTAQEPTTGGMTLTTSAVIGHPVLDDDWSAARERMRLRMLRRKGVMVDDPAGKIEPSSAEASGAIPEGSPADMQEVRAEPEDGRRESDGTIAGDAGIESMLAVSRRGMSEAGAQVSEASDKRTDAVGRVHGLPSGEKNVSDTEGEEDIAGAVCGQDVRRLRRHAG